MPEQLLWAPRAWIGGGWQESVLLEVGAHGHWAAITPGVAVPPPAARRLGGPLPFTQGLDLPGDAFPQCAVLLAQASLARRYRQFGNRARRPAFHRQQRWRRR